MKQNEPKKLGSPILAIWRRLQSGEIRLSNRIKQSIGNAFAPSKSKKNGEETA